MQIRVIKSLAFECETAAGFALPVAGVTPAPGENREIREARLSLSGARKRIRRAALVIAPLILAGCAPAIHLDAPAMPTLPADTQCSAAPRLNAEKKNLAIAPLDPPPDLPDAKQSPCPAGSGLAACSTLDQDAIRQRRFKILHDDRDYCRDAYDRAVTRSGGGAVK